MYWGVQGHGCTQNEANMDKFERKTEKQNKIKNINQNDQITVYKWVKTDEFWGGNPLIPNFSEVCTTP